MAVFSELDWRRFDTWAIAQANGVATIRKEDLQSCRAWLERKHYRLSTIDFSGGIGRALCTLARLVGWYEQFGYELSPSSRNLNALRDGFEFPTNDNQGYALELLNTEIGYREDRTWFLGLLCISSEYSLYEIAQGRRFFVYLVLDGNSRLIGKEYESKAIPCPRGPYPPGLWD